MRSRRRFATLALFSLFAGAINCGREVTAPLSDAEAGIRYSRGVSFKAVFPAALSAAGSAIADLVPFTNVRVTLRHPDLTIALDTVIAFPSNADAVEFSVNVRLLPSAPAAGEQMSLVLNYVNAAGAVVFTGGPVSLLATPSTLGAGTSAPVTVPVVYSGPGANAVKVVINPKTLAVSSGSSFAFTAQALDASNNVIANTPIVFTSSNTALASLASSASGSGTALTGRGTAQITAALLTGGITDVATLTVQPVAASISVVSGSAQTTTAGSALTQPVVFRVLATDNSGVSGVPVTFSPSGGGSASPTTAVSDASGNVQTTWTLGATAGTQTLTASATGFTFSAQATATATSLPASKLAVTQQPGNVAVNAPFGLAIVAQNSNGAVVTTYNGPVTIALGTNTPGATLAGTTTMNAVAGVASFSGLSLNRAGSAYTIVASSSGLTGVTTSAFDVSAAPAASVTLVSGGGQTATQNTVLGQPIVVQVNDASNAPVANATVQFTAATGNGSVSPVSAVTNTLGQASTTWTLGNTVGTQTISVNVGSLPGIAVTATSTASASSVTQLVFTSAPSSAVAGATFSYVVEARGSNNAVVTAFTGPVTLSLSANPASGTLSGTTTVNAVNGVATFSNSIAKASNGYQIVATGSSVVSSAQPLTINPAVAATLTLVSGGSQTATVSTALPSPIVVTLADAFGNPITGSTVTYAVVSGGGSTNPTTGSTNASGQLSTTWTLGSTVGAQSISAAASGVSTITITATGTSAGPGPAASLLISSSPATAVAGSTLSSITVQARDNSNQLATSFNGSVTLAFGANPASGTLNGTTTVSAVNGVATFTGLSINRASPSYTLVATATALSSPAVPLNITAAAASVLVYSTPPSSTSAGTAFAPAIVVSAQDAFGNIQTSYTGNITLAIQNNPSGGVLSGTATVAAIAGQATFSNLSIGSNGNGYTLSATSGSLTGVISAPFNISATTLNWTNPSGGLWSAGSNWSLGRAPLAGDSVVIALNGTYTVTLDVNFSGQNLALGAASGAQTLAISGNTFSIGGSILVNPNGVLSAITSTLGGAGLITNQGTFNVRGSAVSNPIANSGTLFVEAAQGFGGAFANSATGTLRLQGDNNGSSASLTIANGFTNAGLIDLTTVNGGYGVSLAVTSGTLINAATGNIVSSVGAGGARALVATLNNLGTLVTNQPLTLSTTSGTSTNSGTITASAGLTVTLAGTSPAFVNNGAISVPSGQALAINGGTFSEQAGSTLTGAGLLNVTGTTTVFNASIGIAALSANASTVSVPSGGFPAVFTLSAASSTITGPGSLTNAAAQTMSFLYTNVTTPLSNSGTVFVEGTQTFSGAFSNSSSGTLRLQGDNFGSAANLTISSGFTNAGLIDLTTANGGYTVNFNIGSGALTNAATGTIQSSVGAGGSRTLSATLVNQGTLTVNQPLTLSTVSGTSTNSGTINVASTISVLLAGTSPAFVNTGAIAVASGQTFSVSGGAFTEQSGSTLSGAGTLALSSTTAAFNAAISIASLSTNASTIGVPVGGFPAAFTISSIGSTFNGPGSLTNAAGQTMSFRYSDVTTPLANSGTLFVEGTETFSGAFTNSTTGTLQLQGDNNGSTANLTISNGFTNAGLIELTTANGGYTVNLNITAGTLTNASTGTILSSNGAGGARTISGNVDNQGTITVNQPVTLAHSSSTLTNSGTITANSDVLISQSGTSPGFANSGSIVVPAGVTFGVNGGAFVEQTGSTLSGLGTLALTNTSSAFNTGIGNAGLLITGSVVAVPAGGFPSIVTLTAVNSTLNGPGSLINPAGQTMALLNTNIATPLTNNGTVFVEGSQTFSGAFSNSTTGTLRVQGDNNGSTGNLTINNGFTNAGLIDLTSSNGGYTTNFTVASGTLINASTGTITSSAGAGGARTISAQIDNQGTLTSNQALNLIHGNDTFSNSGTINANADITVTQSGGSSTFNNSGSVTISSGHTLFVTGTGFFNQQSGSTMTGGGTLSLISINAQFLATIAVPALTINASVIAIPSAGFPATFTLTALNSTINGPGALANAAGQTFSLLNTNVTTSIVNKGTLFVQGTETFSGAFSNMSTGTMRLQGDGTGSSVNLTISNGFSNAGLIDLTSANGGYGVSLTVGGLLTNAVPGTIQSSVGAGGGRSITAQMTNHGAINIDQPLNLIHGNETVSSDGSITANADFTVTQTGAAPVFQNGGSIAIAGGHTFAIGGGGFFTQQSGATMTGGGTFSIVSVNANFTGTIAVPFLTINASVIAVPSAGFPTTFTLTAYNSSINGPGSLNNAPGQTFSLLSTSVSTPLNNSGTLFIEGSSSFSGAFTNNASGTLRIQGDGNASNALLTVSNGFSNAGLIDLTSANGGYASALTISAGTLTNASGGTLQSSAGAGGTRTISSTILNQGTMNVGVGGTGALQLNGTFTTTGIINLKIASASQYDTINIAGADTLGGTLNVTSTYTPTSGTTFPVITSSSRNQTFGTNNLPAGFTNPPTYGPTSVTLVKP